MAKANVSPLGIAGVLGVIMLVVTGTLYSVSVVVVARPCGWKDNEVARNLSRRLPHEPRKNTSS
eukprot:SAG11_NODE_802_length_7105_cov_1.831573_11_plen_64_part_00